MKQSTLKIIAGLALLLAVVAAAAGLRTRTERNRLQQQVADYELEVEQLSRRLAAKPVAVEGEPPPPPPAVEKEQAVDPGQIEGLVTLLAQRDETLATLQRELEEARVALEKSKQGPPPERRKDFLEELKEKDPKRYEEIKEFRKKATETVTTNIGAQFDFLASLDTSGLDDEQAAKHEELLERLGSLAEFISQLKADPESGEMPRMGREVWSQMRGMRDLMQNERDILLYGAAQELGYEGENAWELVDYIEYIHEMTSPRGIMRGVGWGGGRGGGGDGGGAPGGAR